MIPTGVSLSAPSGKGNNAHVRMRLMWNDCQRDLWSL
jgi:hypothetical protein